VDPRTWRTLILLDLEAHPPRDGIRAIGLRAEPTPARRVQLSLLDPAQPDPQKQAETRARRVEWTAEGRAGAPLLLDTHRPGAFLLGSFAPGAPPQRALPRGGVLSLRPFRPPLAAHVELRSGAPAFVAATGIRGRVADRAGPWHASGDWWDAGWSRSEWDVALAGGGLYRIFRDQLVGAWYVAGELD
jgi:protein ImuB